MQQRILASSKLIMLQHDRFYCTILHSQRLKVNKKPFHNVSVLVGYKLSKKSQKHFLVWENSKLSLLGNAGIIAYSYRNAQDAVSRVTI